MSIKRPQSGAGEYSRPRIWVDTEPGAPGPTLSMLAGKPVFPASDSGDLERVERTAELFGLEVVKVTGRRPEMEVSEPLQPGSGAREVVALGAGLEWAGRLYAHLTGRSWRHVRRHEEVPLDGRVAVVISHPDELHSDFLAELYAVPEGASAPGLICSRNPVDLRRQLLGRAVAALGGPPPKVRRVDIFPDRPEGVTAPFGWPLVGEHASASEMRTAMGAEAGILTLKTHSNGINSRLGESLVLCPRDRDPEDAVEDQAPRCWLTDFCQRRQMSVEEAWASGDLIPPEAFAARILVWDSCNAFLQFDGVVGEPWGLLGRMLANPGLGAVVTCWLINYRSRQDSFDLAVALDSGVPVGEAVARHTRERDRWRLGGLCIFGDPRTRMLRRAAIRTKFTPVPSRRGAPSGAASALVGDVAFLWRTIERGLTSGTEAKPLSAEVQAAGQEALRRLEACAGSSSWAGAAETATQKALLHYIALRGPSVFQLDGWRDQGGFEGQDYDRCFNCERRLILKLRVRTGISEVDERRLRYCPRCGLIEDVPISSDLEMRVEAGNRVVVSGSLPRRRWRAALILQTPFEEDTQSREWPRREDGSPRRSSECFSDVPPGSFTLSFVLFDKTTLYVLAALTRA